MWESELQRQKPSLSRAVYSAFRCQIVCGGFLHVLQLASNLTVPVFIQLFARYFREDWDIFYGYILCVGFFLAQVLFAAGSSQYAMAMGRVGMQLRSVLLSKVFEKGMIISQEARVLPGNSVGKLNNLMTTDTARMQFFMNRFHQLWSCPLQIVIVLGLLYTQLGWVAFVVLGIMLLSLPLTGYISKKMLGAFFTIKLEQDKRLTAMNESLGSMEVTKFYCWEQSATQLVMNARQAELDRRWTASKLQAWFQFVAGGLPVIVSLVSFIVFSQLGPYTGLCSKEGPCLTAGILFSSLSYFSTLQANLLCVCAFVVLSW